MRGNKPIRKHGLQCPLNGYQIGSWVVFLFEIAVSYVIILPTIPSSLKLTYTIIISIALYLILHNGLLATVVDPTDETVLEELAAREKGQEYITNLKHFCTICNAHVRSRSKHCGQCNRCVDVFDHHCQWLNTCVGGKNYKFFARLIGFLFIEVSLKIGFGIKALTLYSGDSNKFQSNFESYFSLESSPILVVYALLILSMIVNCVIWLLSFQLIILHVWLKSHNMTTYEYIVMKREQKKQRENANLDNTGSQQNTPYKSKVIKEVEMNQGNNDVTQNNNVTTNDVDGQNKDATAMKLLGKSWISATVKKGEDIPIDGNKCGSEAKLKPQFDVSPHRQRQNLEDSVDKPKGQLNSLFNALPNVKKEETSFSIVDPEIEETDQGKNKLITKLFKNDSPDINAKYAKQLDEESISFDQSGIQNNSNMNQDKSIVSGVDVEEEEGENQEQKSQSQQRSHRSQKQANDVSLSINEESKCNLDQSGLSDSSKIMKIIDTLKDKVVFKNPLNKFFYVGSGIDLDGGEDNPALISNPSNTIQMFSSSQPMSVRDVPDHDTLKTGDEDEYTALSHRDANRQKGKLAGMFNKKAGNKENHYNHGISYSSRGHKNVKLDFGKSKMEKNEGSEQEVPTVRTVDHQISDRQVMSARLNTESNLFEDESHKTPNIDKKMLGTSQFKNNFTESSLPNRIITGETFTND